MPTSWSDEEYGRVAIALLYPASRTAVVVQGFDQSAAPLAYQLGGRLQQLEPSAKAHVLGLADQIEQAENAYAQGGSGCGTKGVVQVGDIRFDPTIGLRTAEQRIERLRCRLEAAVDFHRNPNASLQSGGGVNGSWSP